MKNKNIKKNTKSNTNIKKEEYNIDKKKNNIRNRGSKYNTSSTTCQSFEESSGVITDNEYEVNSEKE